MTRLGRYFKAPPYRAVRQWHKVELLYEFGERFVVGNSGLGTKCNSLQETIHYLVSAGHDEADIRVHLKLIRERRRHPGYGS